MIFSLLIATYGLIWTAVVIFCSKNSRFWPFWPFLPKSALFGLCPGTKWLKMSIFSNKLHFLIIQVQPQPGRPFILSYFIFGQFLGNFCSKNGNFWPFWAQIVGFLVVRAKNWPKKSFFPKNRLKQLFRWYSSRVARFQQKNRIFGNFQAKKPEI